MDLSETNEHFLRFACVQSVIMAVLAFAVSTVWTIPAYGWIVALVPVPILGILWTVQALVAGFILWHQHRYHHVAPSIVVAWTALYTLIQFGFALSIFTLTWAGSPGAIAGSLQWGGLAFVAWLTLRVDHRKDRNGPDYYRGYPGDRSDSVSSLDEVQE